MIRWTFYFNEGNVTTIASSEEEDNKFASMIEEGGILVFPGSPKYMYVNLDHVKAVTREIVPAQDETTNEVSNPSAPTGVPIC